ncbi:MAG: hypothetical protein QXD03_02205 [Candidatus Anstonellales archaeon]
MSSEIKKAADYFSSLSKFIIDYAIEKNFVSRTSYNLYKNTRMLDKEAEKYTDEFINRYKYLLKGDEDRNHLFEFFRDVVRLKYIINPGSEFIDDSFKYIESVLVGKKHSILYNDYLYDMVKRIEKSKTLSDSKTDLVDEFLRKLREDKKNRSLLTKLKRNIKGIGIPLLTGVIIGGALIGYSKYKKKKDEEENKIDQIDLE